MSLKPLTDKGLFSIFKPLLSPSVSFPKPGGAGPIPARGYFLLDSFGRYGDILQTSYRQAGFKFQPAYSVTISTLQVLLLLAFIVVWHTHGSGKIVWP